MPAINIGEPNEKQKLFLTDTHKYIGFGGARGGGKSWAVRAKAVALCCRYHGIKVMIIRRTYPELYANHIKPLKQMLMIGTQSPCAKYNDGKKEITFPNGSEIMFGYLQSANDIDRYQGLETDVLFLDESTQLAEDQIKDLMACIRGANSFPKRCYFTCNPGGKGHGYIKRLFIDREYIDGEDPDNYFFIQSFVYDNKALMECDPDYVRQLEALPEARRKAWLEGDWNSFVGQVFTEWRNDKAGYQSRRWSHVIDDFEIDNSYKIYRGMDYGYSKPFSIGWYAIQPKTGIMIRIKEFYGCTRTANTGVEMQPMEIARHIREIESTDPQLRGKKIIGIADPAMWQQTTGESIADMMEKERVYFSKADHSRLSGLQQCHYRLSFDKEGFPMFYVFKSCNHFIRTIPQLIYDDHNVEDIDTDLEDHIYDEWRYVCMENPVNPRRNEKWNPPKDDPLNLYVR